MFRLILLGGIIYLGWLWLKKIAGLEIKSRREPSSSSTKNDLYSRMDIQDAEFKDVDDDRS